MLNILANSFMTATRTDHPYAEKPAPKRHWLRSGNRWLRSTSDEDAESR